jgi:predicted nucleotidyltransferase
MVDHQSLIPIVQAQPHPLVFVTISGAHLYGFPSPDSDYDLRGVHVLPVRQVVGLDAGEETIEISRKDPDLELDLVTHDLKKFMTLMLRRNGYVLEQLRSPLVVHTTSAHEELKELSRGCVTKHHAHHYLGFAQTQWKLFEKEHPRRAKPLLYVYRVLLTGIHLMQSGEVEANLLRLNESFKLPYVADLVARKLAGPEQSTLPEADIAFHRSEYERLCAELEGASRASGLPDAPSAKAQLNGLLVRLRMEGL